MSAPTTESALTLVAELAEAAGSAHTEATLVPAVTAVLARHLPLCWFEVHRTGGARGPRVIPIGREHASDAPELGRARQAGAEQLAVIPLHHEDGAAGHALLALRAPAGAGPALTPLLLEAIGRVLAVALQQVKLLARVAELARRTQGANRQLRDEIEQLALPTGVVAVSPATRRILYEVIPLVARQDTTVLVRGETGSGKEVIARRIHALSRRATRPFLSVNCGALPDGLVESALFGHERGAFTGASARHRGLFERAHGGTLLLDEVGELPRSAQAKLLRVLQEGEIERVGGEATVRVDVRVIAATHRPLEAMVADGALREDLYYRLHVFPVAVPPLRERPEDLEPLARAILARLAERFGRAAPQLGAASLARLTTHDWPGNVRELENVLERSLVMSTGDELLLPEPFAGLPLTKSTGGRAPTYGEAMKRCLEQALEASGGKIYGEDSAAAALGLKPTTLQSKMRKLGIGR